jgi:TolA-binding protein
MTIARYPFLNVKLGPGTIRLSGRLGVAVVAVVAFAIVVCVSQTSHAQVDRVYPLTGNPVVGKLAEMRREAVLVESTSSKQTVPVDKIRRILFEGEPTTLTNGRQFALDGQYDRAAEELRRLDFAAIKRDVVKADAMYYLARSEAELALVGRGDAAEATRKLLAFVSGNPQSIHFFRAAKTLGDLAVADGKYDQAVKYYAALAAAPIPELKIESDYSTAIAKLRQGNAAEAEASFDKVINASVQSPSAARLQTLAKAGRALTMAKQGKGKEAIDLVAGLIAELNPDDSEVASRIYNAQGAGYEAIGDNEGAVLAYLHTHLLFSGQADAHAESLARLVELWPKVGNPDRANEARQELQQRYPGWKR